jgi:hypothetical protein
MSIVRQVDIRPWQRQAMLGEPVRDLHLYIDALQWDGTTCRPSPHGFAYRDGTTCRPFPWLEFARGG